MKLHTSLETMVQYTANITHHQSSFPLESLAKTIKLSLVRLRRD